MPRVFEHQCFEFADHVGVAEFQIDALAACSYHAHRLAESTGLQPTPALRELELRILHHDPALTAQSAIR